MRALSAAEAALLKALPSPFTTNTEYLVVIDKRHVLVTVPNRGLPRLGTPCVIFEGDVGIRWDRLTASGERVFVGYEHNITREQMLARLKAAEDRSRPPCPAASPPAAPVVAPDPDGAGPQP